MSRCDPGRDADVVFLASGFLTWCHARNPWTLEKLVSQTALQRQGTRAKVLPMAADGVANEWIAVDVAARLG